MDESIETTMNSCSICQSMRNLPDKDYIIHGCSHSAPWTRIHIDYIGPVNGHMYFVVGDAYSKFLKVVKMKSITFFFFFFFFFSGKY